MASDSTLLYLRLAKCGSGLCVVDCSGVHLDSFLSCHSREEIKVNLPPYRVIKSLCLLNTQCEPKAWMLIRSAISSSFPPPSQPRFGDHAVVPPVKLNLGRLLRGEGDDANGLHEAAINE